MLDRLVASTLIATISLSFTPVGLAQAVLPAQQPSPMVIVPAGTVVPLTLVSPIKSKTTKPGDTIRAAVAFPVTVGDQVAIPPGTYVEGVLLQPLPKVRHQPYPGIQIHFTRLVFANGHSAPLDATQASSMPEPPPLPPSPAAPEARTLMAAFNSLDRSGPLDAALPSLGSGWRMPLMALQSVPSLPPLPPLPHVGPSMGVIVGLGVGLPAVLIALGILFHHSAGNADYLVHDAGWQFQMKLAAPLSLNPNQIALASQTVPAQ
jgi:hypothetical protein